MSSDEAATIIGRMMLERKGLYPREVAIAEELNRIGEKLGSLGRKLRQDAAALRSDDELGLRLAR